MAVKKLALISGSLAAVGIASLVGVGAVSAQSATGQDDGIVSKIAQKFNLSKDEVQQVFDENRTEHEKEREAELKAKLDQAVTDGKITADQEAKLLAKLAEMKTVRSDFKNMTDAEREAVRTQMKAKRTAFEAWLKENNIPTDLVPQGGPKGPGGPGSHSDATSDTSAAQ